MKTSRFVAAAALLAAGLAASQAAQAASHPVKIDNCGVTLQFEQAPKSAVTIGQAGTEMLYALGVGDKVVGTALWFNPVQPQFESINAKVPRLADDIPSFESVINKRPGLVVSQFEWMVGKNGVVGTREQFKEINIPVYAMPTDCEGKDNETGADGTRKTAFHVDTLYKSITQLAAIFGVQPKGEALVKELKEHEAKAVAKVKNAHLKDLSAVL